MIPVALRLRNFMCYREGLPPLELGGIRLACLSGPNGAGKSALLDAITWALWGRARARTDDDLISTGAAEMEVEFEFLLEGSPYRVRRRRERSGPKKAGRTRLELETLGPLGWRSIGAESILKTERQIINLLRMDYETFVNSSFLLQGKADAFTIKQPAERKQVLGDILGLGYYDWLEQRARERLRAAEQQKQALAVVVETLERQLARREEQERAREQAAQEVARWQEESERRWHALEELRRRLAELDSWRRQAGELRERRTRLSGEMEQIRLRCAQQEERVLAARQLLARAPEIEAAYTRLQETRRRHEALSQVASQRLALAEQAKELEQEIEQERNRYLTEREVLRRQIAERAHRLRERPQVAARLAALTGELEAAQGLEEQRAVLQGQEQARLESIHALRAECHRLREEMALLQEKISLLSEGASNCPLCQSPLGPEGLQRVRLTYEMEGKEKKDLYRARESELRQQERELAELRGQIQQVDGKLRDAHRLQQERAVLEQLLAELAQVEEEKARAESSLAQVEGILERGHFALQAREALAAVRAQLEALPYDHSEHQQVQTELQWLRSAEDDYRRLIAVQSQLEADEQRLTDLRVLLQEHENEIRRLNTELGELQERLSEWPQLESRREQAEQEWKAAQEALQQAGQVLGAAEGELERLRAVERELQGKRKALQEAQEQHAIYQELAEALGKRGVQAMLIERAVPEIEREANLLLRQMTDGEMSVQVAMQRATQKGTLQETLEIRVSDLRGTRPYELFSGGERLRIDFALRIALSRLLTRRAGARLQTLVIDEGFGSQDTQGREKLVEAIRSVQHEFEKILVITHLQELKEQFPVRIEIERTAEGSRWTVV
jgi:exonuclease SbcC